MNEAQASDSVEQLERLMTQYGSAVLRMCYMLLNDRETARDATQDTFLKAYRALHSLQTGGTEKAWLMRIAINTCKDIRRSRWARMVDRRVRFDDLPEPSGTDEHPDKTPLLAVMALPDKYRQPVVLHYYQGMTLEEIGQILGMPVGTVRSRLFRARDKLRRALEGWYFDE